MKSRILLIVAISLLGLVLSAQSFSYGLTFKNDLYTRYVNPSDGISSASAGSALINLGIGPKVWIGGDNFTISPEASFMYSPFALSANEYKGLGAISFPVMIKFEFFGLSNMNEDGKLGFALGAGYQWSKTELYGVSQSFKEQGVSRPFYRTFIIEGDFGFGISGFDLHGFIRYGFDAPRGANTLNIGIGYDFNIPRLKEEADPEF